jgi:hypothetical protein
MIDILSKDILWLIAGIIFMLFCLFYLDKRLVNDIRPNIRGMYKVITYTSDIITLIFLIFTLTLFLLIKYYSTGNSEYSDDSIPSDK